MRDFSNGTAVVTGAASGMGYTFAERFAAEGMNVVLADIETDALNAAVARLEQQERSVVGIEVNTLQRESIESLRDQAIERFGNIHVLCNNAGVISSEDGGSRKLWDIPDATWNWVLGVNFYGVLYGIQTFLPHMIEHGEPGHVVNTSSVGGIIAGSGAYSVSKHGVLSLSEGLHIDLRSINSNVSVSVLCPGLVNTNLLNAERNRPDQFGGPSEPDPDEPSRVGSMDDAMNPSNVAELVWDAIINDKCYILPHPPWDAMVRDRFERILARSEPMGLDFEGLAARRAAGELV